MGAKDSKFYRLYRLINNHTGEVFEERGFKNLVRSAGLAVRTCQRRLSRSKKWKLEVLAEPEVWDEATYRKHLYKQTKDRYAGYEEAKKLRDPLYERRKRARLNGWLNVDGTPYTAEQHTAGLLEPCSICGRECQSVVDHCHTTRSVRGTLCLRCNLGLGFFLDSVENLGNAIDYLNNHARKVKEHHENSTG